MPFIKSTIYLKKYLHGIKSKKIHQLGWWIFLCGHSPIGLAAPLRDILVPTLATVLTFLFH